jgi:hypothetical protein
MKYVTFCSAPGVGTPPHRIWEILPGQRQFELFRESIRRVDHDASFVILTDPDTDFLVEDRDTVVIRQPVDHSEIMLERSRRQLDFLEKYDFNSPVVFADTDMLILAPLDRVFHKEFDVALTLRSGEDMPINGGLILVSDRQPKRSIDFFRRLVSKMDSESKAQRREWYGDQTALADMLAPLDGQSDMGRLRDYGDYSALFLDSTQYNYSPPSQRPRLSENLQGTVIYHFKGRCRSYMEPIWKFRIDPNTSWLERSALSLLIHGVRLEMKRRAHKKLFRADTRRKFN